MKILYTALFAGLCFFSASTSAQTFTIEQTNDNGYYGLANYIDEVMNNQQYQELGQTFTAPYPMQLKTLEFKTPHINQTGEVIIEIYVSSTINEFTTLIGTTAPHQVTAGWNSVNTEAMNITLEQDIIYGFKLKPQNGLSTGVYSNSSKSYFGGSSYVMSPTSSIYTSDDFVFRVTGSLQTQAAHHQPITNSTALGLENRIDGGTGNTLYRETGITFSNNMSGTLSQISFHLQTVTTAGNLDISIYQTQDLYSFTNLLATRSIPITAAGWQHLELYDLNIPLSPGANYGIVIRPGAGFSGTVSSAANYHYMSNTYAYANGYPADNGSFMFTHTDLALIATAYYSLPVHFGVFSAQEKTGNISLNWETLNEQNSKVFGIEHSIDGNSWTEIARVPAKGYSTTRAEYNYLHRQPEKVKNFYRLRQEDVDGKSILSKVVSVMIAEQRPVLHLLQNPVQGGVIRLNIIGKDGQPVDAALYDAQGKLLQRRKLFSGLNEWAVPGSRKGIYIIRVDGQILRLTF